MTFSINNPIQLTLNTWTLTQPWMIYIKHCKLQVIYQKLNFKLTFFFFIKTCQNFHKNPLLKLWSITSQNFQINFINFHLTFNIQIFVLPQMFRRNPSDLMDRGEAWDSFHILQTNSTVYPMVIWVPLNEGHVLMKSLTILNMVEQEAAALHR